MSVSTSRRLSLIGWGLCNHRRFAEQMTCLLFDEFQVDQEVFI